MIRFFMFVLLIATPALADSDLAQRIQNCKKLDEVSAQACIIKIDDETQDANLAARKELLAQIDSGLQSQVESHCMSEKQAWMNSLAGKGLMGESRHIDVVINYLGCLARQREAQTALVEQAARDYAPRHFPKR